MFARMGAAVVLSLMLFACTIAPENHDRYIPGNTLQPMDKSAVDSLHDAKLEYQIKKYNMYRDDYKASAKDLKKGEVGADIYTDTREYVSEHIYPLFASEHNIKSPRDYDKFLSKFEKDSIETLYVRLLRDSIVPARRNAMMQERQIGE
ncbi:MAG: hypothetical protein LBK26_04605 [Rickettsiales bacterium]|nr:hypothetical protein [Rickettsiales bacterium]